MGMAIKVKMLLAAKEMTISDLADKIEPKTTRQNITAKLKRNNLTEKDLNDIAKACGVSFEGNFILEDGKRI
ncbi:MAG: transcriptional regulator [Clostridiales bacterium 43-6]|nr:MAG: transcriptional regulator [Clostridiales bacterium 43-6]